MSLSLAIDAFTIADPTLPPEPAAAAGRRQADAAQAAGLLAAVVGR